MRFCVGDEPECNGPECGHAETCPYFQELVKEDQSMKDELDKKITNNRRKTNEDQGDSDH